MMIENKGYQSDNNAIPVRNATTAAATAPKQLYGLDFGAFWNDIIAGEVSSRHPPRQVNKPHVDPNLVPRSFSRTSKTYVYSMTKKNGETGGLERRDGRNLMVYSSTEEESHHDLNGEDEFTEDESRHDCNVEDELFSEEESRQDYITEDELFSEEESRQNYITEDELFSEDESGQGYNVDNDTIYNDDDSLLTADSEEYGGDESDGGSNCSFIYDASEIRDSRSHFRIRYSLESDCDDDSGDSTFSANKEEFSPRKSDFKTMQSVRAEDKKVFSPQKSHSKKKQSKRDDDKKVLSPRKSHSDKKRSERADGKRVKDTIKQTVTIKVSDFMVKGKDRDEQILDSFSNLTCSETRSNKNDCASDAKNSSGRQWLPWSRPTRKRRGKSSSKSIPHSTEKDHASICASSFVSNETKSRSIFTIREGGKMRRRMSKRQQGRRGSF